MLKRTAIRALCNTTAYQRGLDIYRTGKRIQSLDIKSEGAAIAQDFIFAPRLRPCFVHGSFHNLPYRKAAGEVSLLRHEAQGGRKDQRPAVAFDGIGLAAVGARHERKACAPVGRNYLRIPAACKQKQAHTGQKQVPERELQSLVHAKFI